MKNYTGIGCYMCVTPLRLGYGVEVDDYIMLQKDYFWAPCLEEVFVLLDKHGAKL